MRDRVLTYAIIGSVIIHMGAVAVVGRTNASRFDTASVVPVPRFIKVDLVASPDEAVKKPPAPTPIVRHSSEPTPIGPRNTEIAPRPARAWMPSHIQTNPGYSRSTAPPGNPGGKLNTGSSSSRGDLPGKWGGGKTPSGWVPGNEEGRGKGSGGGSGEGRPEPVSGAEDGPNTRPTPPPPPPPAPKIVSVKVCSDSGMLAGEHCKSTDRRSFVEGQEPARACTRCKAPEHTSRLADQEKPILIRDSRPSIPGSVEEGLSVTVHVEYTVNKDGDVTGVEVTKSSGNRAVDNAVVSAASRLKYKPAVQDGVPRSVKMTRTYKINT